MRGTGCAKPLSSLGTQVLVGMIMATKTKTKPKLHQSPHRSIIAGPPPASPVPIIPQLSEAITLTSSSPPSDDCLARPSSQHSYCDMTVVTPPAPPPSPSQQPYPAHLNPFLSNDPPSETSSASDRHRVANIAQAIKSRMIATGMCRALVWSSDPAIQALYPRGRFADWAQPSVAPRRAVPMLIWPHPDLVESDAALLDAYFPNVTKDLDRAIIVYYDQEFDAACTLASMTKSLDLTQKPNGVATMNMVAQLFDPVSPNYPVYDIHRILPDIYGDHIPRFRCLTVWKGCTVTTTGRSKQIAKNKGADGLLTALARNTSPQLARLLREWVPDLTVDGDVESNPGPIYSARVTLFAKLPIPDPQTITFSSVSGSIIGICAITQSDNATNATVAISAVAPAISLLVPARGAGGANPTVVSLAVSEGNVSPLVFTVSMDPGSSTIITYIDVIVMLITSTQPSGSGSVTIAGQPIWVSDYGPNPSSLLSEKTEAPSELNARPTLGKKARQKLKKPQGKNQEQNEPKKQSTPNPQKGAKQYSLPDHERPPVANDSGGAVPPGWYNTNSSIPAEPEASTPPTPSQPDQPGSLRPQAPSSPGLASGVNSIAASLAGGIGEGLGSAVGTAAAAGVGLAVGGVIPSLLPDSSPAEEPPAPLSLPAQLPPTLTAVTPHEDAAGTFVTTPESVPPAEDISSDLGPRHGSLPTNHNTISKDEADGAGGDLYVADEADNSDPGFTVHNYAIHDSKAFLSTMIQPGMEQEYKDHLSAIMSGNSPDSPRARVAATISTILGFPLSNRFNPLIDQEYEDEEISALQLMRSPASSTHPARAIGRREGRFNRKSNSGDDVDGMELVRRRKDKPQKTRTGSEASKAHQELSAEEKAAALSKIIQRIVNKLKSHIEQLATWLMSGIARRFARLVFDGLFGEGWDQKKALDHYEWLAYCFLQNTPHYEMAAIISNLDKKAKRYLTPAFHRETETIQPDGDSARYLAVRSSMANKLVHAYNGNIIPQTMAELDSQPSLLQIIQTAPTNSVVLRGWELETTLIIADGHMNTNVSSMRVQDRVRGNVVTEANAIVPNCIAPLNNTDLIPRHVRPGPSGLPIVSTRRLQVVVLMVSQYFSETLEVTTLAKELLLAVAANNSANWRGNSSTAGGFSNMDVVQIATMASPKGLTMESCLMKIVLLLTAETYDADFGYIPKSLFSTIDMHSVAADQDGELTINASPVFGEACGGAGTATSSPVFPFTGQTGTIAFHLTKYSVPAHQQANAIILPSGILNASEDAQTAIAMYVMMLAEWPYCMYGIDQRTTDTTNASSFTSHFVHSCSTVRVPGLTTMDIILPRRYAEPNPLNAAAAIAQATLQPTFGATLTAANPNPYTPIAVNFVNGEYMSVPLSHYLVSHSGAFNTGVISNFLGRLFTIVGCRHQLEACYEMAVMLTQRFPPLIASTTASSATPVANTPGHQTTALASHGILHSTVTDWPQTQNLIPSFYRIHETDIVALNRVVLGLATAKNLTPEGAAAVPAWVGTSRDVLWRRLMAVPMAVAYSTYYVARGLTAIGWDEAYENTQIEFIQDTARQLYCTTAADGNLMPANHEAVLTSIFNFITERSLTNVETSSIGGPSVLINVFGRFLPPAEYAKVYAVDGVTVYGALVPTIQSDIIANYFTKSMAKCMAMFPPAFGVPSLMGYGSKDNLQVFRNTQRDRVGPPLAGHILPAYSQNRGPEMNDLERHNMRLWWMSPDGVMHGYYDGTPFPGFPPAGVYPRVRRLVTEPGENQAPGLSATSLSCLPLTDGIGMRYIPQLVTAAAAALIRACERCATLTNTAWLIKSVISYATLQARDSSPDPLLTAARKHQPDFHIAEASPADPPRPEVVSAIVPNAASELQQPVSAITLADPPTSAVAPILPASSTT